MKKKHALQAGFPDGVQTCNNQLSPACGLVETLAEQEDGGRTIPPPAENVGTQERGRKW
jgi:hypothetical protein